MSLPLLPQTNAKREPPQGAEEERTYTARILGPCSLHIYTLRPLHTYLYVLIPSSDLIICVIFFQSRGK